MGTGPATELRDGWADLSAERQRENERAGNDPDEQPAHAAGRRARMKRGFASIMAGVLLGVGSLAAFSIFAMLTADARRTSGSEADAQLRQMLMAGATEVILQSKSWDEKANSIKSSEDE